MKDNIFLSELQILKEIAITVNEETNRSKLLSEVLDKLLQLTSLETGWIFLIDAYGTYQLAASANLPPALEDPKYGALCKGGCWCVDKYRKGALLQASNIMECKRLENARRYEWGDTYGLTHHATVPLAAGAEHFGVLNVAVTDREKFESEDLAILESIALQIGTALKRLRLTEEQQEGQLIRERNRLARDLHDSVNQLLFSINLTSKAGLNMTDDETIKSIFRDIQTFSQHAQKEMKALIWQLRPEGLKDGLATGLKRYGEILGLSVSLSVTGSGRITAELEENLWRIGQESLNNCYKHSGKTAVSISLTYTDTSVFMQISDNGIGFGQSALTNSSGFGFNTMKERVNTLGGTVRIESSPGKGTSIFIEIPVKGGD